VNERDIISAGVKIVGLFVLLLGLLGLFRDGIPLVSHYFYVPKYVSAMDSTKDLADGDKQQLSHDIRLLSMIPKASRVSGEIIQILLGIYLCRGGRVFVSLLTGKKEDS